jgi:phosphoglycolate phosphatase-like HAD superfamily hydrolase
VRDQVARLALDVDHIDVVEPADTASGKAERLRALGAVAYVGDTEADARAAAGAGIPFAAVGSGQRSEPFLLAQGIPEVRLDVFEAVTALLSRVGDG